MKIECKGRTRIGHTTELHKLQIASSQGSNRVGINERYDEFAWEFGLFKKIIGEGVERYLIKQNFSKSISVSILFHPEVHP